MARPRAQNPRTKITNIRLTEEERARLNGVVSAIIDKSSFGKIELLAEVRRALPEQEDH